MTKIYKYFIWFFMLTKRLLRQWSFVVLLCMIPIIILLTNLAMSHESGILHVVLCNESNDKKAEKIIDSLLEGDSVIMFSVCNSSDAAQKTVQNHEADAAWIFEQNYSKKLEDYIKHPSLSEPFIRIIEREQSAPLRIAKEKLFGTIYSDLSYSIYSNFVSSELTDGENISQQTIRSYYDSIQKDGDIVKIERLNSGATDDDAKLNYLTAPIRGMLSLMIVLCTLTSVLYFLKEQTMGKFSWLPITKRIIPALASCFSAACLSAIAVFFSIRFSGISTGLLNELCSMILFVISVTGFCMTFSTMFRSAGKFGAVIPGLIIIMFALSPIFFNMKILRPIRLMLPTYYYLQSIYNAKYYLYSIIYCIVTYSLGFILNKLLAERKSFDSVI